MKVWYDASAARGTNVTFWLNVGLAYLAILGVGTAIGIWFGSRRRRGDGGRGGPEPVTPEPSEPTLALDCPPLGSAFDRALLPGVAFADEQIPA